MGRSRRLLVCRRFSGVVRLPDTTVDVSPATPPPGDSPSGDSPAPASVSSPFSSPGSEVWDGARLSSSVDMGYTLGRSSTYNVPPGNSLRSSRRRSSASSKDAESASAAVERSVAASRAWVGRADAIPGKVAASRHSPASSSECSRLRVASALAAFFISTSRLRRRHAGASLSISSASPGSVVAPRRVAK